MDKEAMKQQILESLTRKLGSGFHLSTHKAFKTNLKLDALIILRDGKNFAPCIYLDSFYRELEKGACVEDVTDSILQSYFHAMADVGGFDATPISDFCYVEKRLYVELINRHSNTELLQGVPHSLFLDDFAVVARCLVNVDSDGQASFLVHHNHLMAWGIDQETLLSIAMQNTRKLFGVEIMGMEEILSGLMGGVPQSSPQLPLWVMSNHKKMSGAATVLFDDVLKDFANTHGSFYVIFSSVHEVLLIPSGNVADIDGLTKINREVNKAEVRADEVLGTKAYFYDREKGFVY